MQWLSRTKSSWHPTRFRYSLTFRSLAELDFDAALFSGHRQASESFLDQFSRHEQGAMCRLPDLLKAKVLSQQRKTSETSSVVGSGWGACKEDRSA
eukprot:4351079-Amphidinium_carterae.1